jgi:hypothetical protein
LKDPRETACLWDADTEPVEQQLQLFVSHLLSATPVGPACLESFVVVVCGVQVHDGVYETENETFGRPIYDDIDSHIVGIQCNFFCVFPVNTDAFVTEQTTDAGETTESYSGNAAV